MASHKILLADDEPHITHVVARKMRQAGFDVTVAMDGEEAFELANQHQFGLIVSDLQMPYMSGIELARALVKKPETASIPVIILTARGYVLEQNDLEGLSVVQVMAKPFSVRELLEAVVRTLEVDLTELTDEAA